MDPKTRNYLQIGIIVALLLIIGLLSWFLFSKQHPSSSSPISITDLITGGATSTPTAQNIADINAPAAHITEHRQYYDIDLQYPSITSLTHTSGTTAGENAVEIMRTFSQNTADSFIQQNNLDNLSAQDIHMQGLDQGRSYSLSSTYKFYSTPNTISYVFTIYADTLGAHPNTYYRTFTFDAKTGQSLGLSDIFKPSSNYLSPLSTISRKMLTAQQGSNASPDMINAGTTANDDNFQNFVLDGSNLDIFFPPYQVAAYALGPQVIKIPLSQLKTILKTQYQ